MKKLIYCFCFLPLAAGAQNLYTVSNVPGATANFSSLQTAQNSVPAGSILYVMPSAFSYGDITITKKLTIYGTGYFLGQNLEPNTQANPASAKLNSITFKPGSALSYIEGLQISTEVGIRNSLVIDTVANIIISRCLIICTQSYSGSIFMSGATNCVVRNCYIAPPNFYWTHAVLAGGDFSGIQFNNNIIFNNGGIFYANASAGNGTASFTNNTISSVLNGGTFGNFNYTNNIFVSQDPPGNITTYLMNGTSLFNITNASNLFVPAGNNFQNANTDSIFVALLPGYHSIDQKWKVRDTSFAMTYGQGGVQCGAYGTANAYKLSGIPNLPYVYSMNVPVQATAPGTIGVRIKAKASN